MPRVSPPAMALEMTATFPPGRKDKKSRRRTLQSTRTRQQCAVFDRWRDYFAVRRASFFRDSLKSPGHFRVVASANCGSLEPVGLGSSFDVTRREQILAYDGKL